MIHDRSLVSFRLTGCYLLIATATHAVVATLVVISPNMERHPRRLLLRDLGNSMIHGLAPPLIRGPALLHLIKFCRQNAFKGNPQNTIHSSPTPLLQQSHPLAIYVSTKNLQRSFPTKRALKTKSPPQIPAM